MFSSPTPASGSLASNTLRKAGLMDGDATMRDVSGSKHPRKAPKARGSSKPRASDAILGRNSRMQAASVPASIPIRGANQRLLAGANRRKAIATAPILSGKQPERKEVEKWSELVTSRYNPQLQLLNLSNMIDDPIVKKHNLTPPGYGGGGKESAVIFKLARQLKPAVTKLDLSSNRLVPEHLALLSHYLPALDALSLKDNNISAFKELDMITGRAGKERFTRLAELMLAGNPLQVQEYTHGRQDSYKAEILRRFPTITMLDQEPMARIMFDMPGSIPAAGPVPRPSATTFPVEMLPSSITGAPHDLITSFLFRFFDCFDKNRMSLVDVYHPSSTFSYSANTTIPDRARMQGFQVKLPNQKSLDWKPWLDNAAGGSRNLTRMKQWLDKHDSRLKIGNEDTVRALLQLPNTDHDLAGSAENFSVDTMVVPHGAEPALLVTIHGQFKELPSQGLRSFDRSFVLGIATDGSRAKMAGWDVVVLSDHWTIRNYSSPESWSPGPMLVQAVRRVVPKKKAPDAIEAVPTPPPALVTLPVTYQIPVGYQSAFMAVPEPQRGLLIQLCQATNMTPAFGQDCLEKNGFNAQMALANFEEVKGTLGPAAFMQQT